MPLQQNGNTDGLSSQMPPPTKPRKGTRLTVEDQFHVAVEHPFVIRNIEKGFASLGGPERLKELVQEETPVASTNLHFRPRDRNSKPLESTVAKTNDLLLKISVPKRTGRKRKRGSSDMYDAANTDEEAFVVSETGLQSGNPGIGAVRHLLRSLKDNEEDSQIDVIGRIERTHRFRGVPDFVMSTSNAPFMTQMKENLLSLDYEKLKIFKFDVDQGVKQHAEIIPPPSWTPTELDFNYAYRQNPAVKSAVDEQGRAIFINSQRPNKAKAQSVPINTEHIPTEPSADLPPLESLDPRMRQLILDARKLLEERPIFTRRALQNSLPGESWKNIGDYSAKSVFAYVGYTFAAGPWRDTMIRFGLDPRNDPEYRIYQTMMFQAEFDPNADSDIANKRRRNQPRDEEIADNRSHTFDGINVSRTCKSWQVCDITDPLIVQILSTSNIRSECQSERDGFFLNGTWAKARILTKSKMNDILSGTPPKNVMYERIARNIPEIVNKGDVFAQARAGASNDESKLITMIRQTAVLYRPEVKRLENILTERGVRGNEMEEDGDDAEEGDITGDGAIDPTLEDIGQEQDMEGGAGEEDDDEDDDNSDDDD